MSEDVIKLVVAVPTTGMVRSGFSFSLALMLARAATCNITTRPNTALEISLDQQESSVIHSNREAIVMRALAAGKTHLMFLDDDMKFEPQVLDILLGRRQPVCAVNYVIKQEPVEFVAVGLNGRRVITEEKSTGLQDIAYTGFGVSVFETRVFEKTPQPWFLPEWVPELKTYTTEDNPCYRRIREAGFPVYLDHDASKLVEHIGGSKHWSWRDYRRPEKKEVK